MDAIGADFHLPEPAIASWGLLRVLQKPLQGPQASKKKVKKNQNPLEELKKNRNNPIEKEGVPTFFKIIFLETLFDPQNPLQNPLQGFPLKELLGGGRSKSPPSAQQQFNPWDCVAAFAPSLHTLNSAHLNSETPKGKTKALKNG